MLFNTYLHNICDTSKLYVVLDDHNRVVLDDSETAAQSDYINASLIAVSVTMICRNSYTSVCSRPSSFYEDFGFNLFDRLCKICGIYCNNNTIIIITII
jgi:uncharacterized SAM-dependent methyltransferase